MNLAIDIDGVLCTEERQFSRPLAKPLAGAREGIARLRAAGHTVILYSARTWAEVEVTKHWLTENNIEYDGLQLGKIAVDRFIDDRAIQFVDWPSTISQLESEAGVPGGWIEDHKLRSLRVETKNLLTRIANDEGTKGPVLEVGPMAMQSVIFHRMPETFLATNELFAKRGITYRTLDIDARSGADYIGDLLDPSTVNDGVKFDTIILMSTIEHIPRIWEVPTALSRLLRHHGRAHIFTPWSIRLHGPNPDCWRLSDLAYRELFSIHFKIIKVDKIIGVGSELNPIGFYCVVERLED